MMKKQSVKKTSLCANLKINTENVDYRKLKLSNGYEALFYTNNGENCITLADDNYVFTVTISNQYSEQELIKIVESIK